MYVYWDDIIEPLLAALIPRRVVEIGCGAGYTTRRLLSFCRRHGAALHGVDPAPAFDAEGWQSGSEGHFVFHGEPSLAALDVISDYDAVLVDGDHNWYTVYHELQLIERDAVRSSRPFPLVMLHDVGWPYGRRDQYSDPEAIPSEYRQPCLRAGLRFGSPGLHRSAGLNPNSHHATHEGGPRNGVLTAVEDFMHIAKTRLNLLVIPGFHGLGILTSANVPSMNTPLSECLRRWEFPDSINNYINTIEISRLIAISR